LQKGLLTAKAAKNTKTVFLKSRSPAFLYTDFTESTEKNGF